MLKSFTADDIARIQPLQPDGWPDITESFRFYVEAPFCLPIKCEDNGLITAIGCLILYADTGWLAHIIVSPKHRRQGLGDRVTRELITLAEKRDYKTLLLIATAMGQPLYERLGFRESCAYQFYDAVNKRDSVPSANVRPLNRNDVADILSLDLQATGECREPLLLRSEFRGWVYPDSTDKGIRGYYLSDFVDGPIIARDAVAGTALMAVRAATTSERSVVPEGNAEAIRFLREAGFELRSSAARMVRGGDDPLSQEMVYNRIGGNFG